MTAYEKFNKVMQAFLATSETVSKSKDTYEKYRIVLADFGACLKENDEQREDITSLMVLEYKKAVKSRNVSSNTLRDYLTILHSFFGWAIDHKFYTEQPVLPHDKPRKEKVEYDLLSDGEINKVLGGDIPRYSAQATAVRNRAWVFLLIQTGIRTSELLNLRYGDLDFTNNSIRIVKGKGGKSRSVGFPALARRFVEEYLKTENGRICGDESALLFGHYDKKGIFKPFSRQNFYQVIRSYIRRSVGHDKIGGHDLRHSNASVLFTSDVGIATIQQVLGHASPETTRIYVENLCPELAPAKVNAVFDNR